MQTPKHLQVSGAYWTGKPSPDGYHGYGLVYGDGSRLSFGVTQDRQEAEAKARELAEANAVPAEEQRERRQQARARRLQALAAAPLRFVPREELTAVPTMAGVLSDRGLRKLHGRFPDTVLLPVSQRLAEREQAKDGEPVRWMVVEWQGRGVAVTPDEAEAHGLTEARNWLPELDGVPFVPQREDFAAIGLS